jgi:hypothetical protein
MHCNVFIATTSSASINNFRVTLLTIKYLKYILTTSAIFVQR